ncbi:Kallikrein-7 [Myotis davidii]|uniref:Kallikrein-7 n=1 Tax=Myotis davidii TaxID=225400 RepID=L5LVT3_MYODS|nr:Kallikrein-7 [Myotis davidii]
MLFLGLCRPQDTGERIINGVVCPRGSHPWQVALYDNNKLECSGVLVHQKWVLTVAHCHQSEYIVQMGSDLRVDGRAQRIRATESFIHPRYDNRTDNHDIMLVKLSRPARLSPTVRTIDLPSGTKAPETSCTVSGWGVTTADGGEVTPATPVIKVPAPFFLRPQTQGTDPRFQTCPPSPNNSVLRPRKPDPQALHRQIRKPDL